MILQQLKKIKKNDPTIWNLRKRRKFSQNFDCSCFLLKYPGCEPNIWIIIVSMPPIDQIMFIYVFGGVSSFNLFLSECAKNVQLNVSSHYVRTETLE